jgi:phenylacetate-CoA ligase
LSTEPPEEIICELRESALRERVRVDQLGRLQAGLREVLSTNRFYRARLREIRGWNDFEQLPLTTKAELMRDQLDHPPFGTNLTYSIERYLRLHQTSGTSGGRPLRWLDTAESWDWWTRIWADHVFGAASTGPQDRVFMGFSFGPFIGFWTAFEGAERRGAMVISGGAMNTEQRLRTMLDLEATVLCCTPTYALRMAETAEQLGIDLAGSAVRATVHAGEPGASIPSTRERIERAFGAKSYDHTGMTELGPTGYSCDYGGGVHAVESEFIFEVIDEQLKPLDTWEGAVTGELVATNLGRWGSPLIRYRTGDRVELSREPCACGSPFPKMIGGLRGRVDDMFTVRGVNLYPSQVEDVVRKHPEVIEFRIEVRKVREMTEVTLLLECAVDPADVANRISTELRQALGVRIDCRQVERGTLPLAEVKSKRLLRIDS